jgi:hypothetical protein
MDALALTATEDATFEDTGTMALEAGGNGTGTWVEETGN